LTGMLLTDLYHCQLAWKAASTFVRGIFGLSSDELDMARESDIDTSICFFIYIYLEENHSKKGLNE
ncbi:hypothetical protein AAV833_08885, partial [Geobacillus stearothermophilus]|uniref:hypothetical protein n=1 Tax=Geobacillus stearothermophilus TaxID=1422 RepID=UPI003D1F4291